MGYYTSFEIEVDLQNSDVLSKEVEQELKKMNLSDFFESGGSYYAYDKWNYCIEDMALLSQKFPGVLFTVTGDGEESDDFWRAFFYNGKTHYGAGEIVFPKFDMNKLKEVVLNPDYTYQYAQK